MTDVQPEVDTKGAACIFIVEENSLKRKNSLDLDLHESAGPESQPDSDDTKEEKGVVVCARCVARFIP
jgi:hypothetical protein